MMLTKSVWRKSCLGEENERDQFLVCAKRTVTKFDLTKAVLPMKLSPPGWPMVTIKSRTLLYLSTPDWVIIPFCRITLSFYSFTGPGRKMDNVSDESPDPDVLSKIFVGP